MQKRHLEDFPAIKIGRLAICNKTQKSGLGKEFLEHIIAFAVQQNENCACKFITVDAYAQSLRFYEKLGFEFFSDADEGCDTRQMFLNLTPIYKVVQKALTNT